MPHEEIQSEYPALEEVKNLPFNLSEEEFEQAAYSRTDKETSEDAFLRIAKQLAGGTPPGPNTWGAMIRILERDSMKDNPKLELFDKALEELAKKYDYELKR